MGVEVFDNPRYYHIVKLLECDYAVCENSVEIKDLKKILEKPPITCDIDFRNNLPSPGLFWCSGGGTIILNNRYILGVRRHRDALVNPFKISLFTGRADNEMELANPDMLARELFEELILKINNKIVFPKNKKYQKVIDRVFDFHKKAGLILEPNFSELEFTQINTSSKKITIGLKDYNLDFFINSNNDINVLFLFSIEGDFKDIEYIDGEAYLDSGKIITSNRDIVKVDLKTMNYEHEGKFYKVTDQNTTDHFLYFANKISNQMGF
jgi:hypothetical protein